MNATINTDLLSDIVLPFLVPLCWMIDPLNTGLLSYVVLQLFAPFYWMIVLHFYLILTCCLMLSCHFSHHFSGLLPQSTINTDLLSDVVLPLFTPFYWMIVRRVEEVDDQRRDREKEDENDEDATGCGLARDQLPGPILGLGHPSYILFVSLGNERKRGGG